MATRFDAAADRKLRTANLINYASNYSGLLWIYISSMPGNGVYATIFAIGNNSDDLDFIAIVGNAGGTANLVYGMQINGTWQESSPGATNLAASTWYCLGFIRSSSTSRVGYIGTLTSLIASEVTLTASDVGAPARSAPTRMEIGAVTSSNTDPFNGRVKNEKLWATNRTLAELQAEQFEHDLLYYENINLWCPGYPGATERLADWSGNGYDWTAGGALTDEDDPPLVFRVPLLYSAPAAGGTQYNQSIAGTLTSAGALARLIATAKTGALTSAGALNKRDATAKTGAVTSSGALVKQTQTARTGGMASAGELLRRAGKLLGGDLTSAGAIGKQTATSKAGTTTSAGTLTKQTATAKDGTLTSSGALAAIRSILLALTGTLSSSGALTKQTATAKTGALTPSGALVKQIATLLRGGLGAQHALRFYGGGNLSNVDKVYIRCGEPSNALNVGAADLTLEWWVLADAGNTSNGVTAGANYSWISGNIMVDRDLLGSVGNGGDWGCSLDDGRVAFGVEDSLGNQYTIIGTTDIRDGQWHHVAITYQYSTGDIAVYVDGSREAYQADAVPNNSNLSYDDARSPSTYDPFICLGGEKHAIDWPQGQFIGRIDEFRVSDTLRYTGASYTVPTAPFLPGANTQGLFHFDENTGAVVRDSSGNNLDGSFTVGGAGPGPAWVDSGARLSRPTGALSAIKAVFVVLTGVLSSAGTLARQTQKGLAGAVASSGTTVKRMARSLSGTVASSGALTSIKAFFVVLTGDLTSSGALAKRIATARTGVLTSAGELVKQTRRALAGAVTSSGALVRVRVVLVALTGVLSSAGTLVRQTQKGLIGAVTSDGGVVKRTARALSGALDAIGDLLATLGVITRPGCLTVSHAEIATMTVSVASANTLTETVAAVTEMTLTVRACS